MKRYVRLPVVAAMLVSQLGCLAPIDAEKAASVEGSIVTLVVRGRYTGLDGKPAEEVNSVRFRHSESGYKLMLTPQLEAMATVLASNEG